VTSPTTVTAPPVTNVTQTAAPVTEPNIDLFGSEPTPPPRPNVDVMDDDFFTQIPTNTTTSYSQPQHQQQYSESSKIDLANLFAPSVPPPNPYANMFPPSQQNVYGQQQQGGFQQQAPMYGGGQQSPFGGGITSSVPNPQIQQAAQTGFRQSPVPFAQPNFIQPAQPNTMAMPLLPTPLNPMQQQQQLENSPPTPIAPPSVTSPFAGIDAFGSGQPSASFRPATKEAFFPATPAKTIQQLQMEKKP